MTEKINKINNPLTIIAIFAALAEINATIAIGLIDKSLHYIFIWFIIAFPTILVICFFATLNFNTKVMYSPSDYKEDKSFMDSLFGNNYGKDTNNKFDEELLKISDELEAKLTEKLSKKFENTKASGTGKNSKSLEEIRKSIKEVTDESIQELREKSILKTELKATLLEFYQYPAFYLLIYAVIKSKATTLKDLKKFAENFYIPENWENAGISRLLKDKILLGTRNKFSLNHSDELERWANLNEDRINNMSVEYKKVKESNDSDESSRKRELMIIHSARLKF